MSSVKQTLQQQEVLQRRLPFVIIALVIISGGLLLRMVVFQLPQDPEVTSYLQTIRDANYGRRERLIAERGRIFDRDGYPLAVNTLQYEIGVSPNLIADPRGVALKIAAILGRDERDIFALVTARQSWVQIARPVSADVGQQIAQLQIFGVTIAPIARRYYPQGALAGHLIGFVAGDGEEARGYNGVEGKYQENLAGRIRDQEISNIPFDIPNDPSETDKGSDLVLTIDRDVQFLAESELQKAVTETGATGGTIIVMDPRNGDVLALANYPPFDPNNYYNVSNESLLRNAGVSEQYEPGSVMKVVTMAAGLEKGTIVPQSTYNDTGVLQVGGIRIYNWDRAAHGVVDMTQVLVQSLNIGASTISINMGNEKFYTMMSAFGFGRSTGIDLEGEASGTLKVPGTPTWSESDLGTNAYGQGVAVTPLQMITAVSAIANGGLMMQPRVVYQIVDGQNVITARPAPRGRPISAETARWVTEMMVATVRDGVDKAVVPGYTVAGKSGTAEIPNPALGYEPNSWIMSFIGFLPADDPQVIVLIKLDRPTSGRWASAVVAPVFSRFVQRLVVLLEIPPDDVRHMLTAQRGA